MAFIPAQYCAKLVPLFEYANGNQAVNVLTFNHAEAVFASDLELLTDVYQAWWDDTAAPFVANTVKLMSITATDLTNADGLQHVVAIPGGSPGGNTGAVMPANVTFTTTFKTAFSGRSFRGRAYWIGLCENQVVGDLLDATQAENIRDAWETLGAGALESQWTHSVLSYVAAGVPRVTAEITQVTTYVNYDRRVDTQRRRLA